MVKGFLQILARKYHRKGMTTEQILEELDLHVEDMGGVMRVQPSLSGFVEEDRPQEVDVSLSFDFTMVIGGTNDS
jgi:hypothetical protein